MVAHFVITRFNLKLDNYKRTKDGDDTSSDAWLSHRFRLFETYCLPSLKCQTNQNFKWCVLFDDGTPEKYRDRNAMIADSYPNFIPLYIRRSEQYMKSVVQFMEQNILTDVRWVISSRLDNDDMLHKDFISDIQDGFRREPDTLIDPRDGYQLTLEEAGDPQIRLLHTRFGHFISLVESAGDNIRTVMYKKHKRWRDNANVQMYTGKPLWAEIIHRTNKRNRVRKNYKRLREFPGSDFGIPGEVSYEQSETAIRLTNLMIGATTLAENGLRRIRDSFVTRRQSR